MFLSQFLFSWGLETMAPLGPTIFHSSCLFLFAENTSSRILDSCLSFLHLHSLGMGNWTPSRSQLDAFWAQLVPYSPVNKSACQREDDHFGGSGENHDDTGASRTNLLPHHKGVDPIRDAAGFCLKQFWFFFPEMLQSKSWKTSNYTSTWGQ